jgi:hypothetical protein
VFLALGLKSFPDTNILAYYEDSYLTAKKSFITLAPGAFFHWQPLAMFFFGRDLFSG